MKKLILFLIATVAIVATIWYVYAVNEAKVRTANHENKFFENYYQRQVYGGEVATVINKAMDNNYKNNIEKDKKNLYYIENDTNSIKINLKMLDNEEIYPMELFAKNGIQNFMEYYNNIQFKCTDIKYHQDTKLVKSLLFEQVTIS